MNSELTSENFPPSFYRVSVKGLVVKDGKVLLLKEAPSLGGMWELPGGGLDFGEDIHEGLRREIEEEMGIKVTKIAERPLYSWTWRFLNKRGMDWYYSLVLVYQIELENFDFKISEECQDIGFFGKEEMENMELCHQTNGLKKVFDPKDFIENNFDGK